MRTHKPLLASRNLICKNPLQGNTPLYTRQPLRGNPDNAYELEFRAMQAVVARRSQGRCEVRIYSLCTGFAQHTHHRKLRTQGGTNDIENLVNTCNACHTHIHSNKKWAYEQGWLVKRDDEVTEILPMPPSFSLVGPLDTTETAIYAGMKPEEI